MAFLQRFNVDQRDDISNFPINPRGNDKLKRTWTWNKSSHSILHLQSSYMETRPRPIVPGSLFQMWITWTATEKKLFLLSQMNYVCLLDCKVFVTGVLFWSCLNLSVFQLAFLCIKPTRKCNESWINYKVSNIPTHSLKDALCQYHWQV